MSARPPTKEEIANARAYRPLPASPDAEKGLISSLLISPIETGALCAERGITAAHFHIPAYSTIFMQVMAMWAESSPIDIVTLSERLRTLDLLDHCGGVAAISEFMLFLPTAANARQYIDIVLEKRSVREMVRICETYAEKGYQDQGKASETLAALEGEILAINAIGSTRGYTPMKERIAKKTRIMESDTIDEGVIKTGIPKLDKLSPMRRGGMIVIAAPRKAGKSMLAITICRNAMQNGHAVFYASLEQPEDEQVDRALHGLAKVPTANNHWTKIGDGDLSKMTAAMSSAARWRFDLRDDLYDVAGIIGAIRQAKIRWPDLAIAVVDYCQLVRGIRNKGDTREMEIASVSLLLRRCALHLKIVVILLSQLNKEGDSRESMAIEQDMTAMWKLSPPPEDDAVTTGPKVRTLSIPRQRMGASGVGFKVLFRGDIADISECDDREEESETQETKKTFKPNPNYRRR